MPPIQTGVALRNDLCSDIDATPIPKTMKIAPITSVAVANVLLSATGVRPNVEIYPSVVGLSGTLPNNGSLLDARASETLLSSICKGFGSMRLDRFVSNANESGALPENCANFLQPAVAKSMFNAVGA